MAEELWLIVVLSLDVEKWAVREHTLFIEGAYSSEGKAFVAIVGEADHGWSERLAFECRAKL